MKKMKKKKEKSLKELLKSKEGIKLDIGCGSSKQPGFIGMDIIDIPGVVDIIHNVEEVPYPLPKECCHVVLASHILEHICPKKIIGVMNELWRILKEDGQLFLAMPYGGSSGFWQDPTHCHSFNEATTYYFTPYPDSLYGARSPLYDFYKPLPWKIVQSEWLQVGNLQIILQKMSLEELAKIELLQKEKGAKNVK